MGCSASVHAEEPGSVGMESCSNALVALRKPSQAGFVSVKSLINSGESNAAWFISNGAMIEFVHILANPQLHMLHSTAAELLALMIRWAVIITRADNKKNVQSCANALVQLVDEIFQRSGSKPSKKKPSQMNGDDAIEVVVESKLPFRILECNGRFLDEFEASNDLVIGRALGVIFGPRTDGKKTQDVIEKVALGKEVDASFNTFYNLQGKEVLVDLAISKRNEESCSIRMHLSKAIFEDQIDKIMNSTTTDEATMVIHAANQVVEKISEQFTKIYGVTPKQIVGRGLRIIYGPTTDIKAWDDILMNARKGFEKESPITTYDLINAAQIDTVVKAMPVVSAQGLIDKIMLKMIFRSTAQESFCNGNCQRQSEFISQAVVQALGQVLGRELDDKGIRTNALEGFSILCNHESGLEKMIRCDDLVPTLTKISMQKKSFFSKKDEHALKIIENMAAYSPCSLKEADIDAVIEIACQRDNFGNSKHLTALRTLLSLTWNEGCIRILLQSPQDVLGTLDLINQQMIYDEKPDHQLAASQAALNIRMSRIGQTEKSSHRRASTNLMNVIDDNHRWGGNDPVLLAEAFRELNNSSRTSGHRAISPVAARPRRMSESVSRKSPEVRQRRMSLEGSDIKKGLPYSRTRLMSDSDISAGLPTSNKANNIGWEAGARRLLSPVPSS